MSWFGELFGFEELDYASTQARFRVEGTRLYSAANGASYEVGVFTTPSLAELRARAAGLPARPGGQLSHVAVADILNTHSEPDNAGALFQVASQFNCLEFASASVVPERGVTGYMSDNTQGPACALAAAPATVYRNYLVPLGTQRGQTRERQIDNLAGLATALAPDRPLWDVRNGYTFSTEARLAELGRRIAAADREQLLGHVRIGLQTGVEVCLRRSGDLVPVGGPRVSQAFCSALSCSYAGLSLAAWEPLATLVLDATYEATLLAAALDRAEGQGSGRVWLTFIGGDAFGNEPSWIHSALARAVQRTAHLGLDVRVAHFRSLKPVDRDGIERARAAQAAGKAPQH